MSNDLKLSTPTGVKVEALPQFLSALIEQTSPSDLKEQIFKSFNTLEQELLSMRVEMAEIPTTESLVKLYSMQARGRSYYERSEEIFRQYLKFLSTVTLLNQKAGFMLKQQIQKANIWMRENRAADLKNTKSGEERNSLIESIIPENLFTEKLNWEMLESQVKTNFTLIKSYRDQFKSINDNVLIQLSIFKNLIMLGELKVDPEIVRAMRVVDSSYSPTRQDYKEKQESDSEAFSETNMDEGTINLL